MMIKTEREKRLKEKAKLKEKFNELYDNNMIDDSEKKDEDMLAFSNLQERTEEQVV